MKNTAVKISFLSALILGLAVISASAQLGVYRANIPFDFVARGETMKAGEYRLAPSNTNGSVGGLILSGMGSDSDAVVLGIARRDSSAGADKGTLTFVLEGDHYALRAIDTEAYSMKFKRTATSVKQVASTNSKPEIVEIGLTR